MGYICCIGVWDGDSLRVGVAISIRSATTAAVLRAKAQEGKRVGLTEGM